MDEARFVGAAASISKMPALMHSMFVIKHLGIIIQNSRHVYVVKRPSWSNAAMIHVQC